MTRRSGGILRCLARLTKKNRGRSFLTRLTRFLFQFVCEQITEPSVEAVRAHYNYIVVCVRDLFRSALRANYRYVVMNTMSRRDFLDKHMHTIQKRGSLHVDTKSIDSATILAQNILQHTSFIIYNHHTCAPRNPMRIGRRLKHTDSMERVWCGNLMTFFSQGVNPFLYDFLPLCPFDSGVPRCRDFLARKMCPKPNCVVVQCFAA